MFTPPYPDIWLKYCWKGCKMTIFLSGDELVLIGPLHDKKKKNWPVRPEKTQISLHTPSLIRVFAVRMKKYWVLGYLFNTQWRHWSDWADAQADWVFAWHTCYFIGFVVLQLIYRALTASLWCQALDQGLWFESLWKQDSFRTYVSLHFTEWAPSRENLSLWGLQPGKTQTDLLSYRSKLESWNCKYRNYITKVLIRLGSCAGWSATGVPIWHKAGFLMTRLRNI